MPITFLDDSATPAADYAEFKMQFAGPSSRWTETHRLSAGTVAAVKTDCIRLATARARLLAGWCYLIGGHFSYQSVLKDSYPVVTSIWAEVLILNSLAGPAAQETVRLPTNNVGTGFLFRLQANNGKFSTFNLRGIRDQWVEGNFYNAACLDATANAAEYPVGGPYLGTGIDGNTYNDGVDTETQLVRNYLSLLRDKTALFSEAPPPGVGFLRYGYVGYDFTEVKTRQTGVVTSMPRGRQRSFA